MGSALAVRAVAADPRLVVVAIGAGCLLTSVLGGVVVARSGHRAGPLLVAAGIVGAIFLRSSSEGGAAGSDVAMTALAAAAGALTLVLVSLPEGTFGSRLRRAVAMLAVFGTAVVAATAGARGADAGVGTAATGVGLWLGGSAIALAGAGACVALLARARAARGDERAKLAWPAAGACLTAGAATALVLLGHGLSVDGGSAASSAAWVTIGLALPIGLIVGAVGWKLFDVWRLAGYLADYRLWTASFVALAVAVVAVVAVAVGSVLDIGWWRAIGVGVAAVVTAFLADVVRAHLQGRVDRRFGQRQEDPARTMEDLAARWTTEDWDTPSLRGPVFDLLAHVAPMAVAEGIDGIRFAVRTDDREIGRHTFVHGAYDLHTMELAVRLLADRGLELRGRTFLDVGANIGTASVVAIRRFGAAACVAIEPAPENLELLRWNVALNGMQDVATIFPVAVSDHEGRLTLRLSDSNAGDHRLRTAAAGPQFRPDRRREIEVDVVSLDGLLERAGIALEALGLVWMDVQGHEGRVLSGAPTLLASGVPIVVELWPSGLRDAGGLGSFWQALEENYRWAVDLRAASDDEPRPMSVSQLRASIGDVGDPQWFTDILAGW
ncbi:MAG: FkbM family methyltransferase [Actinomycetota bacterium]